MSSAPVIVLPPSQGPGQPWLAPRLFGGGADGQVIVRDVQSPVGASWVDSGGTLVSTYADPNSSGGNLFVGVGAGNRTSGGLVDGTFQTDGSHSTGVGYHALAGMTTGSGNVAIGYDAMANAPITVDSVAVGYGALSHVVTTGADNTALGYKSMKGDGAGVSGVGNVSVGHTALFTLTSGQWNVAAGKESLYTLTTGSRNVAVGFRALYTNAVGNDSVAIGYQALVVATVSDNVAVGAYALQATTTGTTNTALGERALIANTTGTSQTAVGYAAGGCTLTGVNNVVVGESAGLGTAAVSYSSNTLVGTRAGYTNPGSSNVFLGFKAGYYETGDSKLFIDNQQRASEADARLKALIYGVFGATVGAQTITFNVAKIFLGTGTANAMTLEPGFLTIWDQAATIRAGTGPDTTIARSIAGYWKVSGGVDYPVVATPAAPGASFARLYADTSGAKVRLLVIFPSGAAQLLATEP